MKHNQLVVVQRLLAVVALLLALAISAPYSYDKWDSRAVVVNVSVEFEPEGDQTRFWMKWRNRRECQFSELVAVQGSDEFPDELREPVRLSLGPPKGSRGIGTQQTDQEGWVLHRPGRVFGPDIIITAWHRCGGHSVRSTMVVAPIQEVFPSP